MKRCQPDGRSDVRTFLFPWSWVSPLMSGIDFLPVERKASGVTPALDPASPLLCAHVCAPPACPQQHILEQVSPERHGGMSERSAAPCVTIGAGSAHPWEPGNPGPGASSTGWKIPSQLTLSVIQRLLRCSQPRWGVVSWAGGEDRGGVLGRGLKRVSFSILFDNFYFRVVVPDLPL